MRVDAILICACIQGDELTPEQKQRDCLQLLSELEDGHHSGSRLVQSIEPEPEPRSQRTEKEQAEWECDEKELKLLATFQASGKAPAQGWLGQWGSYCKRTTCSGILTLM